MIIGHIGGAGSPYAYEIQKSLRLRASASAHLSRTPGVSGNGRVFTLSLWCKRGALTTNKPLLSAGPNANADTLRFTEADQLQFWFNASTDGYVTTSAVFRDPCAHLHIQLIVNTTESVAANRLQLYVNGNKQTIGASVAPALNYLPARINAAGQLHYIGYYGTGYFDGYLSEINFIDGQALTPTSFGEFNSDGVWVPKKYTGLYGTNGFYLPFSDGSSLANLMADKSGNGNSWTANNVSLTAGATYDWMEDTPTNNYCTLNPINPLRNTSSILSQANLRIARASAADCDVAGTFAVASGKWYFECTRGTTGSIAAIGICLPGSALNNRYMYIDNGNKQSVLSGAVTTAAYGVVYGANAVVGVCFDADSGALAFYVNGVSQGAAFTGISLAEAWAPYGYINPESGGTEELAFNFGQHSFAYTPPTGFKALCTKNLPPVAITNPRKHFDIVLDTGANIKTATEALFPANFFEWIKDRANSNNHQLIDIVRGTSAVLQSNTTAAETVYSAPAGSSVGWVWKAGGAPVVNNAGSIQSQVSANVLAGFSIVTYTGTGANATVGHGLGVAPKLVIAHGRSLATGWATWHAALLGTEYLNLHLTDAKATAASLWNSTIPNSTVFSLGTHVSENSSGAAYVAYCFAEVPGFSKVGSYLGNSNADGPFVWCGFRPRWILIKRTDSTGDWVIHDAARSPINTNIRNDLFANLSAVEATDAYPVDILANGFKVRNTGAGYNINGGTYIFYAIAEQPFNAPSNAR